MGCDPYSGEELGCGAALSADWLRPADIRIPVSRDISHPEAGAPSLGLILTISLVTIAALVLCVFFTSKWAAAGGPYDDEPEAEVSMEIAEVELGELPAAVVDEPLPQSPGTSAAHAAAADDASAAAAGEASASDLTGREAAQAAEIAALRAQVEALQRRPGEPVEEPQLV